MKKELIIHIPEKAKIQNPAKLVEVLKSLNPGDYYILIKDYKKRSLKQNAYYWSVVVPMVKDGLNDQGWDEIRYAEEAHEVIKGQFLSKSVPNTLTGEILEIRGSSSDLTTTEFLAFIDQVIKWAAEFLGIQIPYPNEKMIVADE